MSDPLSQQVTCQVCGTKLTTLDGVARLIWDRLCEICYRNRQDSKYYATPATALKQEEKMNNVESQGRGKAGLKDDKGKPMWELLPWKALNGLISILTFGASKYAPNGWRTVPNARERYTAALLRHLYAIQMGEKFDKESGLKHVDHLLCNAAFLSELED